MNKILYLADYGNIKGGGEVSLIELIKNLDRTKFTPVVVIPSNGEIGEILKSCGITFYIIPLPALRGYKNLYVPSTVKNLVNIVRKEQIHLIHSNSPRCGIYGGFTAKLLKLPNVCHVRVATVEPRVDKLLDSLATRIIAVSKFVTQRFHWLHNKRKLLVIYNGVDTQKFRPGIKQKIREEIGISDSTFLIGTVGQLLPYKGHKFVIQAIKEVGRGFSLAKNVKLLIVGDERKEGYKKELENQAENLGIQESVIFLKFRADVPEILNALDLFVLPPVHEHFGRVLIEAMACALPVVATNVGAPTEIIENMHSGILVPPMDTNAMSEAIIYLMKNKENAKNMGTKAREQVERLFSIKKNVEATEQIYNELLH